MLPVFIMAIENDDDRTFVAELYARCQPAMQRRALSILKNESDAEEAVHEATGTGMAAFCYAIPVCRIHHNLYMKNGLFV